MGKWQDSKKWNDHNWHIKCGYTCSQDEINFLKYPGQNLPFGHTNSGYYACNTPLRFAYVLWGGNWISFIPCSTKIINHTIIWYNKSQQKTQENYIWDKMNQKYFPLYSPAHHQIIYSPFFQTSVYISHTNRCF